MPYNLTVENSCLTSFPTQQNYGAQNNTDLVVHIVAYRIIQPHKYSTAEYIYIYNVAIGR